MATYWSFAATDGNGDINVTINIQNADSEIDLDQAASDMRDAVEAMTGVTTYVAQKHTDAFTNF